MTLPWNAERCGDRITLTVGRWSRVLLVCVLDQHPDTHPHRSATEPEIRWRRHPEPESVQIWIKHSEGLFG